MAVSSTMTGNSLAVTGKDEEIIPIITTSTDHLEHLSPFLHWLKETVLKNQSSRFVKSMKITGFAVGAVSTFAAYSLGAGFGVYVAQKSSDNEALVDFSKVFFGMAAIVPTAILVAIPTQEEFRKLAALLKKHPELPSLQNSKGMTILVHVTGHLFSVFAGIPFFGLLRTFLAGVPFIDIAIPATTLIANYLCSLNSELEMASDILTARLLERESNDLKAARKRVHQKISAALKKISSTSTTDTEIHALYHQLVEKSLPIDSLNDLLKNPSKIATEDLVDAMPDNQALSTTALWGRRTVSALGFVIGAASMSTLYSITQSVADSMSNSIGATDEPVHIGVKSAITTLAMVPNIVFIAFYCQKYATRLYDSAISGNLKPSATAVAALSIAAVSSVSNVELAIQNADSPLGILLIIPAFLGPSFSRALAFEVLVQQGLDYINDFDKDSAKSKRARLITVVEKIRAAVKVLEPGQLLALDNLLSQKPENVTPDPIQIIPNKSPKSEVVKLSSSQLVMFPLKRNIETEIEIIKTATYKQNSPRSR